MSSLRSNRNLLVLLPNLTSGNLLQILNCCVSTEQELVEPDYKRFDGLMMLYMLHNNTIGVESYTCSFPWIIEKDVSQGKL